MNMCTRPMWELGGKQIMEARCYILYLNMTSRSMCAWLGYTKRRSLVSACRLYSKPLRG
jgi:hypothetical protein